MYCSFFLYEFFSYCVVMIRRVSDFYHIVGAADSAEQKNLKKFTVSSVVELNIICALIGIYLLNFYGRLW